MEQQNDGLKIPDIINKSSSKNFTQISNQLLRNEDLSYKAKGLISLLLSNEKGWCSYLSTLESMGADGVSAIKTGLQELEKEGYLLRIRYRDKEKKRIQGSFWIYTDKPGEFEGIQKTDKILREKGMVADWPENLQEETLQVENLIEGNQRLKRHNNKKTNNKNNNSVDDENSSNSSKEKKKLTAKERTKKYIPLAKYLAKIVRSHIDYNVDESRIKSWARDLRLLHEQNGVHPKRQKKVMHWYKKNIGGDYIPEAFSGSSFREKFPKLESAIERQKNSPKSNNVSTGYRRKDGKEYETDFEI